MRTSMLSGLLAVAAIAALLEPAGATPLAGTAIKTASESVMITPAHWYGRGYGYGGYGYRGHGYGYRGYGGYHHYRRYW